MTQNLILSFQLTSLWSNVWKVWSLKSHSFCTNSKVALIQSLTQQGQVQSFQNHIASEKCLRVYKSGQWSTICHFRQPYCTSIRIQYNSRFILLYLKLKYNQTKMWRQWEWQYFKIFKIRFSHLNQFVFPCSEQKADHLRKDNYNLCSFYFSTAFTIYCHNLFSQFMQLLFFQPSQEENMCGLLWSVEY